MKELYLVLAGGGLFMLGTYFGSYSLSEALGVVSSALKDANECLKKNNEVLSHLALFKHDKAKALQDEKVPALYFGPDGKTCTSEEYEQAEQRVTSVTNEMLNQIEAAEARAKEMMEPIN